MLKCWDIYSKVCPFCLSPTCRRNFVTCDIIAIVYNSLPKVCKIDMSWAYGISNSLFHQSSKGSKWCPIYPVILQHLALGTRMGIDLWVKQYLTCLLTSTYKADTFENTKTIYHVLMDLFSKRPLCISKDLQITTPKKKLSCLQCWTSSVYILFNNYKVSL